MNDNAGYEFIYCRIWYKI